MTSRRAALGATLALLAWTPSAHAAFPGRDGTIAATVRASPRDSYRTVGVDPATGSSRTIGLPFGALLRSRYSADGRRFYGIREEAYLWTSAASGFGRRPVRAPSPVGAKPTAEVIASGVAPGPDGRLGLAVDLIPANANGPFPTASSIRIYDGTDGGLEIAHLDQPIADPESIAFSPDGSRLAFVRASEQGPEIWTVDADGSDLRRVIAPDPGENGGFFPDGRSFDFSPDGKRLVFVRVRRKPNGFFGGDVHISDLATGREATVAGLHDVDRVLWSPSGTRLAVARRFDDGSLTLETVDVDGADRRVLHTFAPNALEDLTWQARP